MIDITLKDCIDFQEIYWHDGVYSSYEQIVNIHQYFPLVIIGEIGTLINNYYKQVRSPNDYNIEIENDCADIFICIFIYILWTQKKENVYLIDEINQHWLDNESFIIKSKEELNSQLIDLIKKVSCFISKDREKYFVKEYLLDLFKIIQNINKSITDKSWQEVINKFHTHTFKKFTEFDSYTPDS